MAVPPPNDHSKVACPAIFSAESMHEKALFNSFSQSIIMPHPFRYSISHTYMDVGSRALPGASAGKLLMLTL